MTPSICLVTTWGGAPPPYLPLFFATAAHNPTIDFVFVADSPQPYPVPSNVRWVHQSMPDMLASMGARLGCDLSRSAPYKLCDLRPGFGVAFADLLDGYHFWGHVDCDIVLGDLRAFATDEVLAAHDVLSFKGRGFIHGPLTLWRNTEGMNCLFERADWRQIFETEEYLGFDEVGKRWSSSLARRPVPVAERRARGEVACATDLVYEAAAEGWVRIYDHGHVVETKPRQEVPFLALRWERGKLTNTVGGQPLAYFHIHWAKSDPSRGDPAYVLPPWHWDTMPERFGITREGIRPIDAAFHLTRLRTVLHPYEQAMIAGIRRVGGAVRRRLPVAQDGKTRG
jgi:hypothetical protein